MPLASDEGGVLLVQDRVEDRLPVQTRRESAVAAFCDQVQLILADGTVENYRLFMEQPFHAATS